MNAPGEREDSRGSVWFGPTSGSETKSLLLHHQMIGERLYLYSLARFLVVVGIVGGVFFARHVVGIENLDVRGLLLVAGCLFVYNVVVFAILRRYLGVEATAESRRFLVGVMNVTIFLDFIFLTIALWLVGGAQSPFKAFYLIHVILACVLLPLRMVYFHAALGYLMFAALVVCEWKQWIPVRHPLGAVPTTGLLDSRYVLAVLVVQALLMTLPIFFLTGLVKLLRKGEADLRHANEEVKRFSEMQRNFLHIALHDVKAPVGAAMMFLSNIRDGLAGPLKPQQEEMLDRAQRRLGEITDFLRDFEILAALDTVSLEQQAKGVDIVALLKGVREDYQDVAALQGHTFLLNVSQHLPRVRGIERLLREAVANLVSNAIKYTPRGGYVTLRAQPVLAGVRIEVEDTGIGILPSDRQNLFQDFMRIRRKDAAFPDPGGSGLGLSIVRRVVEMHGGRIGLVSGVNSGSTFSIELPSDGE